MKVKELLEALLSVDPEAEVILQKDSEGNGYSPLCCADANAVYVPDSTWSGDVYDLSWTHVEAGMSEYEWAELNTKPKCVVLSPVN